MRSLAYGLREGVTWSPPAWTPTAGLAAVLAALPAEARPRARRLVARYDTSSWAACCDLTAWRESLYVLDLLEGWLDPHIPEGRCVDVGSKNACYLPGLAAAVPRGWDAVEIDAHRRYLDGTTRRAHGERTAAALRGCRFVAGDIRDQPGPWAVATWFLPFLTPGPLAAWGLPDRLLAPEALLTHVAERIVEGGTLIIVNQGEREAELQGELFARLGLSAEALGRVESALSPFHRERFAWRWRAARSRARG